MPAKKKRKENRRRVSAGVCLERGGPVLESDLSLLPLVYSPHISRLLMSTVPIFMAPSYAFIHPLRGEKITHFMLQRTGLIIMFFFLLGCDKERDGETKVKLKRCNMKIS